MSPPADFWDRVAREVAKLMLAAPRGIGADDYRGANCVPNRAAQERGVDSYAPAGPAVSTKWVVEPSRNTGVL